jgi:hypothetical protein
MIWYYFNSIFSFFLCKIHLYQLLQDNTITKNSINKNKGMDIRPSILLNNIIIYTSITINNPLIFTTIIINCITILIQGVLEEANKSNFHQISISEYQ